MSLEAWGDEPWGAEYEPDIERLLGKGYRSADDMTKAAHDVIDERLRQQQAEGWTPNHDDQLHDAGDLSAAASCYAIAAANMLNPYTQGDGVDPAKPPGDWPWEALWWKPGTDPRRALVKAGAVILAEIERIDRAAAYAAANADPA